MAAGSTYTPIATTTIGSAVSSYTFSSIPSTYTDLVLIINPLFSTLANINFRYNSDSGTNYSDTYLQGDGSTASSGRDTSSTFIYGSFTGSNTSENPNMILNIMNYANTTTYKTSLHRWNNSASRTGTQVSLWRSTSAINSITLLTSTGNFAVGSTFTLYGITAA